MFELASDEQPASGSGSEYDDMPNLVSESDSDDDDDEYLSLIHI